MASVVPLKHCLIVLVMILKVHCVPDLVKLNEMGNDENDENKFGKMIEFEDEKFEDGRIKATNEEFVGNGVAKDIHEILEENQRGILNNFQFFGQRFVSNNDDDDDDIQSRIKVKRL